MAKRSSVNKPKSHLWLIALILIVVIAAAIAFFFLTGRKEASATYEQLEQTLPDTCEVDADCGVYAQCASFSSAASTLYAACSYVATVKPACINNKCVYNSESHLVKRCLPSCAGDKIVPQECLTPRDSRGDQNGDAECIAHPETSLTCSSPSVCKNVYSGNCQGITAACVIN